MSLCTLLGAAAKCLVTSLDGYIYFPVTGKYALTVSQKAYDKQLIDKLNTIIYAKAKEVPAALERAFAHSRTHPELPPNAVEREAIHSFPIRVFIHMSQIPATAQEFFKSLNHDQKMVCFAYLTAIDQGKKYGRHYERISSFAKEFLAIADRDERAYYEERALAVPKTLIEGNPLRPVNAHERINLGPKFQRHPVTALMLGECRRILFPKIQVGVDGHFHSLNMKSRAGLIEKMKDGPKESKKVDSTTITTYATPLQVEFFPDRKKTDKPSYLNDIQGAGALTTEGFVTEYSFGNGKVVFLVKYKDYKTKPTAERYLVSTTIPIGAAGEEYVAGLDLESAQKMIDQYGKATSVSRDSKKDK